MSDFNFDLRGMDVLEAIKAYPEQDLALMRKNYRASEKEIFNRAISLAEEFRKEHPNQPSTDRVCELIKFLEDKLDAMFTEENTAEPPQDTTPILELKTDYDISKRTASYIPKVYLGQEINTPLGKGIVTFMSMPSNGLYVSPERAELTVWFSTQQSKDGWVQHTFNFTELKEYL